MAFVNSLAYLTHDEKDNAMQASPHSHLYTIVRLSPDVTVERHTSIVLDEKQLQAWMPAFYRYCRSLTTTHWDAQDLMQNTLLKALTLPHLHGQRSVSDQQAYLLRIARNLRIDEARRAVRLQHKLPLLQELLNEQQTQQHSAPDMNLQAEAAIKLLLDTLSPWQHAVYALRELFGYTASEAANLLGTTEGAIKSALRRAREALLQQHDDSAEDASLPMPEQDEHELLATYLAAFRNGNAAHLVQLILNQAADPAGLAPQIVGQLHTEATAQSSGKASRSEQLNPHIPRDAYPAYTVYRSLQSIAA